MAAAEKELVYGRIPVPTWRWLGVNEVRVPEAVFREIPVVRLVTIPAGETQELIVVCRDEAVFELRAEVGAGAELRLTRVRLAPEGTQCADKVKATLAENARLVYTAVNLGGAGAADLLDVDLAGDGSRADVSALYFADGRQKLDMNYVARQRGKDTDARLAVQGGLADEAEKNFRGTLNFARGAVGSVGRERESVTLLSPNVVNRSAPLMLSGEAEVDGRHATTVGKLDEEKLYYLTSRGLSPADAKRLVVLAAAAPVLDRIEDKALAEEIRTFIEGRLSDD
ncbi:MAG: SufD family Fe-S cluster assembly protein [Schwartzia sp.]|nr:SufD family Fe-S cluster assembly protein [Schwartzia sp. (in: firmicutes)]